MPSVGVFAAVMDEKDRILCTKINYGSGNWTLPGGHLEKYESPIEGVKREVLEETGYIIDIDHLISIYSAPSKDDLVLLFRAGIKHRVDWEPNQEIEQVAFFERDQLPANLHKWNRKRMNDAYENQTSHLYIFN